MVRHLDSNSSYWSHIFWRSKWIVSWVWLVFRSRFSRQIEVVPYHMKVQIETWSVRLVRLLIIQFIELFWGSSNLDISTTRDFIKLIRIYNIRFDVLCDVLGWNNRSSRVIKWSLMVLGLYRSIIAKFDFKPDMVLESGITFISLIFDYFL